MVIESLDKDIHPGDVMLHFGGKRIIATYGDRWLYHMTGQRQLPHSEAVYGTYDDDKWVLSRNIRALLDWIDGSPK